MSMQGAEAKRQIDQMVNFIMHEAHDKAQEIEARALEDFNVEKLKLVQQMKNKVRMEYQQRAKQMETQRAIARSMAINKSRLRKIGARNAVVEEVRTGAAHQLAKLAEHSSNYKKLCTDLITQKTKRSFDAGKKMKAAKLYTEVIKKSAQVDKKVKLIIDKENYLPPGPSAKQDAAHTCIGGVMVTTADRKIVVDNTLDARLGLVMDQCMPTIRKTLFPAH